jgi:hypothetical protein
MFPPPPPPPPRPPAMEHPRLEKNRESARIRILQRARAFHFQTDVFISPKWIEWVKRFSSNIFSWIFWLIWFNSFDSRRNVAIWKSIARALGIIRIFADFQLPPDKYVWVWVSAAHLFGAPLGAPLVAHQWVLKEDIYTPVFYIHICTC